VIKQLQDQVQYFKNEIAEFRARKVTSVDKSNNKEDKLIKLKKKLQNSKEKIKALKASISEDSALINELQEKLKNGEESHLKLWADNLVLTKTHNDLKENFEHMTSSYSNVLAKLKQSYDKHKDFDLKISELEEENYKLALRASVAFDDLTPRPNLDSLFLELDLAVPKKSTLEKANILFNSVQGIKKSLGNSPPKQILRRSVLVSKSRAQTEEPKKLLDTMMEEHEFPSQVSVSSSSKSQKVESS
jgi:chromosome segregation ATPase